MRYACYCSLQFVEDSVCVPGRYWFRPVAGWVFKRSGRPVFEAWEVEFKFHPDLVSGHQLVMSDPAAALKNGQYADMIREADPREPRASDCVVSVA